MKRCSWCNLKNPLYIKYHDEEWGIPKHGDQELFELLVLEMFQAGLSWETILNKRESFKVAFDNFDVYKISKYNDKKLESLMNNKEIIRNRRKINASINNAKVFIEIKKEYGSFDNYIWQYTNGKVIKGKGETHNSLSDMVSKDLKSRGTSFVGTTIIYSYLQAIGIINDHEESCYKYVNIL